MPEVVQLQSTFTAGELDPRLHARVDTDFYQKGAKKLENVVVLPQGGVQRRFGLQFVDDIGMVSGITDPANMNVTMLEFEDSSIYLVIFVNLKIHIYFDDNLVATEPSPYVTAQIRNLDFVQDNNSLIVVNELEIPFRLERVVKHSKWSFSAIPFKFKPAYDFTRDYDKSLFSINVVTGSGIRISSTLPVFTINHVGGVFAGNEGTMRLTGLLSPTEMVGDSIVDFKNISQFSGLLAYLAEPVFSTLRGWPKHAAFFQDRLIFGGTTKLPNGIWGSKINDVFNFDDTLAKPADAFDDFLGGNGSNVVLSIVGIKTLVAFTQSGEFTTGTIQDTSLTPGTAFVQQSQEGSSKVKPVIIDNKIVYIAKGGKIVNSFIYDIQRGSYQSINTSIRSAQIIRNPISSSIFQNPVIDDGNYLFLVNEDGTLATLQILESENVQAWTLQKLEDTSTNMTNKFELTTSIKEENYFIIKRFIKGVQKLYIEKLDFNCLTDSCTDQTFGVPTSIITGLDHLEGETVRVRADDAIQNSKIVVGGQITLDEAAKQVEVGLNYNPTIIPMPLNVATQNGNDLYLPKRIKGLFVDYYVSLGIYVNETLLPNFKFNDIVLDTPPAPQTGVQKFTPMKGWNPRVEVVITQIDPLPMTLRGLGFYMEI